jgi:thymidylate synthase ThyX
MENPYLITTEDGLAITPLGLELLTEITTDPIGPVYVFTDKVSRKAVAAAMGRLSRSANDTRIIYLDEFAGKEDQVDALLKRVVTEFGDDSVQQLMPIMLVVELASNLLTKKLEWGRLAAYLEQSTRYIFFDHKIKGRYRYFIPELPENLQIEYQIRMDEIFDRYSNLVREMTSYYRSQNPAPPKEDKEKYQAWMNSTRAQACDTVRTILPTATKSTVGIVGSAQSVDNLIMNLAAEDLKECTQTAVAILRQVRKVAAAFYERTDLPERGGATVAHKVQTKKNMREFAKLFFGGYEQVAIPDVQVNLINYWPKDELEIVPNLLWSKTRASFAQIQETVSVLTDDEKRLLITQYIGERFNRRHKPGRAFEDIRYKWEIVGDYGTFRDLQRHRMVDEMEWQNLTPYLGYAIPDAVVKAGFRDQFERCYEISAALYRTLFDAGFEEEAQYATLMGHRMRYKFTINARASYHLHEIRTTPHGHPGYRRIVQMMHDKVSEVHPMIAKGMKFVNMGEDPVLARLAAEMASQQKLALLSQE